MQFSIGLYTSIKRSSFEDLQLYMYFAAVYGFYALFFVASPKSNWPCNEVAV